MLLYRLTNVEKTQAIYCEGQKDILEENITHFHTEELNAPCKLRGNNTIVIEKA